MANNFTGKDASLATVTFKSTDNAGVQTPSVNVDNAITATVSSSALPTGASTSAKQPALGTAGSPSSDVITVQGVTSMTALKTDGSGVTQPVSGNLGADLRVGAAAVTTSNPVPICPPLAGSLAVSGTVAIGAGSASIGTLGANSGVDIGDVTINNSTGGAAVNIQDGGNTITVDGTVSAVDAGDVAHDSGDSGNPVKVGAKALSADQTAVSTADRTNLLADLLGKLVTSPYALVQQLLSGVTGAITDTTATQVIAGVASNYLYITSILVTNSHATVGTFVKLEDGSGGTIIWEGYAAAAGGGFQTTFTTPLKVPTSGNGLYAQCVTTGSNVIVSAAGYKATI